MTVGCKPTSTWLGELTYFQVPKKFSPNHVLTHAARAAAKRLCSRALAPLVAALWWPRAARAKGSGLLSLHNPVARAARALTGRYTRDAVRASEPRGARRAILV